MKNKLEFLLAIIGCIVGFIFHLVWHFKLNIILFSFSSHIINGTIYTGIGGLVGLLIGYLISLMRK